MSRLGGIGALVLIALTVGVVVRGMDGADPPRTSPPTSSPHPVGGESPTASPPTAVASEDAAETLAAQIERVAGTVAGLRGLAFVEIPEPTLLSPADLSQRVREDLATYTDEAAVEDARLLSLLGAIPRDYPLRERLTDAYAGQVAGYYDPDHDELVVGAETGGERLGAVAEVILAHELEHALADQTLGLPALEGELGADEVVARQALVEGDATLLMQEYVLNGMGVVDQLALVTESLGETAALGDLEDLPHFLRQSLLFPYEAGLTFVSALHEDGGWAAVDRAYDDRPTTTFEILFPDRYRDGFTPTAPPDPTDLAGPWELTASDAFGAADLLLLARAPGGDPARALRDPLAVAGRWRGGVYELWTAEDASAVGVGLAVADAEACRAVLRWYAAAFPDAVRGGDDGVAVLAAPEQTAAVSCRDGEVVIGIAPSEQQARRMTEAG